MKVHRNFSVNFLQRPSENIRTAYNTSVVRSWYNMKRYFYSNNFYPTMISSLNNQMYITGSSFNWFPIVYHVILYRNQVGRDFAKHSNFVLLSNTRTVFEFAYRHSCDFHLLRNIAVYSCKVDYLNPWTQLRICLGYSEFTQHQYA